MKNTSSTKLDVVLPGCGVAIFRALFTLSSRKNLEVHAGEIIQLLALARVIIAEWLGHRQCLGQVTLIPV